MMMKIIVAKRDFLIFWFLFQLVCNCKEELSLSPFIYSSTHLYQYGLKDSYFVQWDIIYYSCYSFWYFTSDVVSISPFHLPSMSDQRVYLILCIHLYFLALNKCFRLILYFLLLQLSKLVKKQMTIKNLFKAVLLESMDSVLRLLVNDLW